MKTTYNIILGLLLCLTCVGCSSVVDDEVVERVSVGDHVPAFTVETVIPGEDGSKQGTFSTSQLTGETVIVFFHTTCPDCQRDLPLLNQYYLQHRDDAGFQMVAISRAEDAASVAAFWAEHKLQMPYSPQSDRTVYELFASSIIPRIYFVSPQGIVTRIDVEKYDLREKGKGKSEKGVGKKGKKGKK